MWATVMYNLQVVNAVQRHSGVSYGVGYFAQTIFSIVSSIVRGAIALQEEDSPSVSSTLPPAIGSEWEEP